MLQLREGRDRVQYVLSREGENDDGMGWKTPTRFGPVIEAGRDRKDARTSTPLH
jgi:hypothetical protein